MQNKVQSIDESHLCESVIETILFQSKHQAKHDISGKHFYPIQMQFEKSCGFSVLSTNNLMLIWLNIGCCAIPRLVQRDMMETNQIKRCPSQMLNN